MGRKSCSTFQSRVLSCSLLCILFISVIVNICDKLNNNNNNNWYIVYHNHRILLKDFPTNLLPLLKLKIFKTIILFALSVCYFKCTLVPEAFYEAKETESLWSHQGRITRGQ